jgi:hypothetical protein
VAGAARRLEEGPETAVRWGNEAAFQQDRRSVAAAQVQRRVRRQQKHDAGGDDFPAVQLQLQALQTTAMHVLAACAPLLVRSSHPLCVQEGEATSCSQLGRVVGVRHADGAIHVTHCELGQTTFDHDDGRVGWLHTNLGCGAYLDMEAAAAAAAMVAASPDAPALWVSMDCVKSARGAACVECFDLRTLCALPFELL